MTLFDLLAVMAAIEDAGTGGKLTPEQAVTFAIDIVDALERKGYTRNDKPSSW